VRVLTVFEHAWKDHSSLRSGSFSVENSAQTVTIKPEAKAIRLSKSRDFWFTLIAVVGPDAAEFFFVDSAVFCGLQLALNLL
jgi:hypothetical protein